MTQAHIVILSQDPLFSEALSEQCTRELDASCRQISQFDADLVGRADLLICDQALDAALKASCHIPVLALEGMPLRMVRLLRDILGILARESEEIYIYQGIKLIVRQRLLVSEAAECSLTDKEVSILQHLHGAQGALVQQDDLLKNIWDYDSSLDTHTLQTHIYRLRNKLREAGAPDTLITAEDGGYKLEMQNG